MAFPIFGDGPERSERRKEGANMTKCRVPFDEGRGDDLEIANEVRASSVAG
jgi:hypothetical protein